MSDNKKYYYMKLKENFFDTDEMIILESMPDGYLYSNILLKLYLRSLKDNGCLMFKGVIPYTPDVLAKVVRHNVGVVEKAIQVFKQLGLVEILDNGAIYMLDIQNFIGESSTEADRIRQYRKKVEEQKKMAALEANSNESTNVVQMYDKSTPELEIELDIDLEKEKTTTTDGFESLERTHLKIFGGNIMSPIWMSFYQKIRDKGYSDGFIQELILEASESSSGKVAPRYVESIFARWHAEGITSREQAKLERIPKVVGGNEYGKPRRNARGHTEEDRIAAERDADLPNIVRPTGVQMSEMQRQRIDDYIRNT